MCLSNIYLTFAEIFQSVSFHAVSNHTFVCVRVYVTESVLCSFPHVFNMYLNCVDLIITVNNIWRRTQITELRIK
jgi:hypothetical protein